MTSNDILGVAIAARRLMPRWPWTAVLLLAALVSGCSKSATPAPTMPETRTRPAAAGTTSGTSPKPTTPPSSPSTVAPEVDGETPRPSVIVLVDGGPNDHTLWRGWPVIVHLAVLAGEPPQDLRVSGPSAVEATRAKSLWVIPETSSAQLAPGGYVFSCGAGSTEVKVEDPPAVLSPDERVLQRSLKINSALALGEAAAAARAADEWVAAEPSSFEAYAAQGDALLALGKRAAAFVAYNEAIRRVPRGDMPPAGLHAQFADLLREAAAALPATTGKAPSADEASYHNLIDAGDDALAAGDRAKADREYAAAEALHRDKHLSISRGELDEKRAALGGASSQSPPASVGASSPRPTAVLSNPPAPGMPVAQPSSGPGVVLPAGELGDAIIRADAAGQWAASATAGSQYGKTQYSPAQATGAPNIFVAGNSPDAWCPENKTGGIDWLEVTFAKPVHATEVRVRQNDAAGAITKIEAIEPGGPAHVWWEGADPYKAPAVREIIWFAVRVPKTPYFVARVKITLNLAAGPGWKEIDAVQLVGAAQ